MWDTTSLWFEVAIISILFALGNMVFGVFEERTPRWRRVVKYLITTALVITISIFLGRAVAFILLGIFFLPVVYIHAWYLPRKKGISGWTAEPKSKYYEFRKWDKNIFGQE